MSNKTPTLSLAEGEKELSEIITMFARETTKFCLKKRPTAPKIAIKATAGLGKTTQVIKDLIGTSALRSGPVHYYVPTHRLAGELEQELDQVLDIPLTQHGYKGPVLKRSFIIAGRSQKDKDGNTLCRKIELANLTAASGLSVSKSLCKNANETCEFYGECGYQEQFKSLEPWLGSDIRELDHYVTVMTHNNMFLPLDKRIQKPSLIVVDEAFYQTGISQVNVNPMELYRVNKPISIALLERLAGGETHLLDKVRELGFSANDLLDEAALIEVSNSDDSRVPLVSPSLAINQQQKIIGDISTKKRASLILRAIAKEMKATDRGVCHSVRYDSDMEMVVIHERKELELDPNTPIVFIDADVQKDILEKLKADVYLKTISVERLATFHQATDLTFSKNLLLNKGEETEKTQKEIKRFVGNIAKDGTTLLVCSKEVRAALTGESKHNMKVASEFEGATIIHFGNLRGLNEYSDYQNVIILGREQPPAVVIENNARSLWWDDKETIKFLAYKGKHKPLEKEKRAYQHKDNSTQEIDTPVHPDKRVQLLLEQVRENESIQAIDRLRLLRPHKNGDRNVYILSNVPLELTIDNLFSWRGLQKLIRVIDEAEGVLPLNPRHLKIKCPSSVSSLATAKRLVADLKELSPLISIYIREMSLFSIEYRAVNKGKYSTALVSDSISIKARDKALASFFGKDDFEVKEEV